MHRLTDDELIEELKRRCEENMKTLYDLRVMTGKLEDVNKKLQESEALKSNFLSNIRNEINNPLMSIMGLSEELASEALLDSETGSSLAKVIYSEAFNLDFQLMNIFAAAELEAGETALSISKVDIDKLISSAIERFKRRADEKKMKISYGSLGESGDNPYFRTDPEKLQLVMSNILSNAIEFSHEEGRVELRAWNDEGHLNISVKDCGIGIVEAEQEVIFDRFKQLDTGVAKNHMGHGLGLSITKAVIELLSGTISAEGVKDEGSIFTLSIPEAETETEVDVFSSDGNEFIFEGVEEF